MKKILGYLRGLKLQPCGPLCRQDGGLNLSVEHGHLSVGYRAHLYPNVKISIRGKTESPAMVIIGEGANIGDNTQIHCEWRIYVGNNVLISWDVTLLENLYHSKSKGAIRIEDDVHIGCKAIILSGVTIGRGARIGAGSVVTKSVPAGETWAGNPAKKIR